VCESLRKKSLIFFYLVARPGLSGRDLKRRATLKLDTPVITEPLHLQLDMYNCTRFPVN